MRRKIAVFVLVILMGAFFAPEAKAATIAEMQAQIRVLVELIAKLQAELSSLQNEDTTTHYLPDAPYGLTATAISQSAVKLSWYNSNGQYAFKVQEYLPRWGDIRDVYITKDKDYIVQNLAPNTRYTYQVVACADETCSRYSSPSSKASATTLSNIGYQLHSVNNFTASLRGDNQEVKLNWNMVPGASCYTVYRSTERIVLPNSGATMKIRECTTETVVLDEAYRNGLVFGQMYYYQVMAISPFGDNFNSYSIIIPVLPQDSTTNDPELYNFTPNYGSPSDSVTVTGRNLSMGDTVFLRSSNNLTSYHNVARTTLQGTPDSFYFLVPTEMTPTCASCRFVMAPQSGPISSATYYVSIERTNVNKSNSLPFTVSASVPPVNIYSLNYTISIADPYEVNFTAVVQNVSDCRGNNINYGDGMGEGVAESVNCNNARTAKRTITYKHRYDRTGTYNATFDIAGISKTVTVIVDGYRILY
ncbi:MAG: fibronectin type III domain-containing protein [Candidatus Vogelbacteria bacterium]|nr:fibronectin type III domain-containing protein [Candidatus Vogelbacteria bacterium]